MLFTSLEFLCFVALLLAAYYLLPRRWQPALLLIASYVFYGLADPRYLIFIAATTLTVWGAGRMMDRSFSAQKAYLEARKGELDAEAKKAYKADQKKRRRRWLTAALLCNLIILAAVKYLGFFTGNLNALLGWFGAGPLTLPDLILPMGISFYTFQSIGYLVDVYRGTVPAQRSLWRFALFVSFFPQLVQGPISRYADLAPGLLGEHPFRWEALRRGGWRVLWGFFKKMVVADRLATAVLALAVPGGARGANAAALLILYTVQLYADFTGGIDITIGVAEMLGIPVKENFDRPFCAVSLKDYWRRWHITMCTWFRDYLFYPVSTSGWMRKLTKGVKGKWGDKAGKRIPVYLSSFIVWFATGLWHGANWNFVVWGLCNWAVLMISEELEPLYGKFHARFGFAGGKVWHGFMILRTFLLVAFMNLFDCFSTLSDTFRTALSVFVPGDWTGIRDLGLSAADWILAALGTALMFAVSLLGIRGSLRDRLGKRPYVLRFALFYGLVLAVLLFGAYGMGYDAGQFIYNRF